MSSYWWYESSFLQTLRVKWPLSLDLPCLSSPFLLHVELFAPRHTLSLSKMKVPVLSLVSGLVFVCVSLFLSHFMSSPRLCPLPSLPCVCLSILPSVILCVCLSVCVSCVCVFLSACLFVSDVSMSVRWKCAAVLSSCHVL